MIRYISIKEKRRNPDQNPHIGAWDYLIEYKDDPDVYISFTEIDKIGINPLSKYNTPVGVYAYPLKEFIDKYFKGYGESPIDEKYTYKHTIGNFAPFAGKAKYINFIRIKDKSNFIEDMYKDYGSNDYDRDIGILKKKYNVGDNKKISSNMTKRLMKDGLINLLEYSDISRIIKEFLPNLDFESVENFTYDLHKYISHNDNISASRLFNEVLYYIENFTGIDHIIKSGLKGAKNNNPITSMWNITRLLAESLSNSEKQAATKWNLILSKDLGYSGFADKSGKGYIHPSEPMQAVFLRKNAFKLLHRVENKPKKGIEKKKSQKDEYSDLYDFEK